MAKKGKALDPHADREADNYDNPIPSREYIQQVLAEADQPLSHMQVCDLLQLKGEQQVDALRRRLRAMERDGQLLVNRKGAYGLVNKMDLVHGRVQGHRDGYGFLLPLDEGDDLYLSARQMALVFDGDEVLAKVSGIDSRGRKEGKIVEVLKRGLTDVVGRYFEESGIGAVIPDNARVNHILIPPREKGAAQHGQIVCVEITGWPTRHLGAKGRITEVLGEHLDPGMEIDVAIRAHSIPHVWPEDVLKEAAALDAEPAEADKRGRVDLRQLPFVTIDGEDARDFDDAVYCEQVKGGGWKLWVAIADVAHYVRPGSALDEEAITRGNSVYFPERVVPMLPEALSNGLCSLKPQVDRLAMVCEMSLSPQGTLHSFAFFEGVIHSHARLTYTQVGDVLEQGRHPGVDQARVADLQRLHGLYKVLREARAERGAIDFETVETRIVFDQQRKIEAIVPVHRNDAHKLIEECMLCANVATARFFEAHEELPILFRVHEGPSAEKLENLRNFLGELGLDLSGGAKPSPLDYQNLLALVAGREDAHIIQTMLLRSLSQAVYQPENKGHFGLNYDGYAHFTSPIRRYPDLLVHRGIRRVLRSDIKSAHVRRVDAQPIPAKRIFPYDVAAMAQFGEQCSMSERRADDATREVDAWLKCEYLLDHVGDEFAGVVAAVTSFGLFVELSELYVEGLVHISSLPGDYYHFDRGLQRLSGERTGRSFNLGDSVRVQVARVNLDEKKVDLELIEATPRRGKSGKATKRKAGGNAPGSGKKPQAGKKKRKTGLRKHHS